VAGVGISGVESSGSATTVLVSLDRQIVKIGGGWNWLRIVSSGGLWY
jgi:hypothetical protein